MDMIQDTSRKTDPGGENYIELPVKGMTCSNCALSVEKYLKASGAGDVAVDLGEGAVSFELLNPQELPGIIKGIEKLGYEVPMQQETQEGKWSLLEKRLLFSVIFTLPLLLHMFVSWQPLHNPWIQLALCLPVFLTGLIHFGKGAWYSVRSGIPNMDVLIILGATAAFAYSLYGTLTGMGEAFLFYETAASIITLVMVGNWMEHRSVRQTTSAVRELTRLQKSVANKIVEEAGAENILMVPAREVQVGDLLLVREGEKIPVDGVVEFGDGEVDAAMITGESEPESKHPGDQVIGGTVLTGGNLRVRAQVVGKATVLAQIIEMVKKAQAEKPQIQRLADKISAVFVPVVVGIALLTFVLSYFAAGLPMQQAIIHAVAVLVIACPCAMGLATPTAVVVGIGRASRQGILIKGGKTLETFSSIERVVFDKTGTLTTGQFLLTGLQAPVGEQEAAERVLLALANYSQHPKSRALQKAFQHRSPLPLSEVREEKGLGIAAMDQQGNAYKMGSFRWAEGLTHEQDHSTYLLKNGQLWATVDMEDEIVPGAKEAIDFIKSQGIEPILLSGDKQSKCEAVASQLGITQVYGECLPGEKLEKIKAFVQEGPTAMVGDGINDAPALSRATLGISLGHASAIAVQSAQIILLHGGVAALPDVFKVGKHTILTIRQNLFWAFFYNVLAIPLAALGFLSPIIAAMTMALSDVVVVGNSLRLKVKRLT